MRGSPPRGNLVQIDRARNYAACDLVTRTKPECHAVQYDRTSLFESTQRIAEHIVLPSQVAGIDPGMVAMSDPCERGKKISADRHNSGDSKPDPAQDRFTGEQAYCEEYNAYTPGRPVRVIEINVPEWHFGDIARGVVLRLVGIVHEAWGQRSVTGNVPRFKTRGTNTPTILDGVDSGWSNRQDRTMKKRSRSLEPRREIPLRLRPLVR